MKGINHRGSQFIILETSKEKILEAVNFTASFDRQENSQESAV